jgi:SAM-dependent methyltransferase
MPGNIKGNFLDIGCGLGYLTEVLGNGYFQVGMETDDFSIKYNVNKGRTAMVKGDASHLPFKKDSFDIILCSDVLEHLPDRRDVEAFTQMVDILKPGGQLFITVPSLEGLRAYSKLRNLGHDDPGGGEFHYRIGYKCNDIKRLISNNPSVRIKKCRYSMFLISELFMDLQKLVYLKQNKFKEQSDIAEVKNTLIFRLYKFLFPLLLILFIIEDMLFASIFKGHILIFVIEKKRIKE